jgi:hypothetical protein
MGVALEDSYQSESQRREVGQLDAGELKKRKEKKNIIYIYIYKAFIKSSYVKS